MSLVEEEGGGDGDGGGAFNTKSPWLQHTPSPCHAVWIGLPVTPAGHLGLPGDGICSLGVARNAASPSPGTIGDSQPGHSKAAATAITYHDETATLGRVPSGSWY